MSTIPKLRSALLPLALLAACGDGDPTVPPPTPASIILVAGDGQTGAPGAFLDDSLVIRVLDRSGNAVGDLAVEWSVEPAAGAIEPGSAVTDAGGRAAARWRLAAVPGAQVATATVTGVDGARFVATARAVDAGTVRILPDSLVLESIGASVRLRAEQIDGSGEPAPVEGVVWSSTHPDVASVDSTGLVVAKRVGTTLVSAVAGERAATAMVVVRQVPAQVSVRPQAATVLLDATQAFEASVADARGVAIPAPAVRWASSDTTVATVDGAGTARGVGAGTAAIIAVAGEVADSATLRVAAATTVAGSVSAGARHTCAVGSGGVAYCWGSNDQGQLGNDAARAKGFAVEPVPVNSSVAFSAVAAGHEHTCALGTDGVAYCWGDNEYGQLGDGTRSSRFEPAPVGGGLRFERLDAGSFHTCGVSTDGAAYCWGDNGNGQLGRSTPSCVVDERATYCDPAPGPVQGGLTFETVSAGHGHTCGLTVERAAYCWGPEPRELAPGHTFHDVAVGRGLTCAAVASGDTYRPGAAPCWGQLPGGRPFRSGPGDRQITAVTVSLDHACGLDTAGAAYCWGSAQGGQLGDGSASETERAAVLVAGGHSFRQISAGGARGSTALGGHTCGLTTDGEVYCWGYDEHGRLGSGDRGFAATPSRVDGTDGLGTLVVGGQTPCALDAQRAVVCWGELEVGFCEDDWSFSGECAAEPRQLFPDLALDTLAGFGSFCGLATNDAHCWRGYVLGDGSAGYKEDPVAVAGDIEFASISPGAAHICGLSTSGQAYCWGSDPGAPLYGGRAFPTRVAEGHTFESLSAGSRYACGIEDSGDAYCWGFSGLSEITSVDLHPVPGGHSFNAISAGVDHACGIDERGDAWCWGRNDDGRTGTGAASMQQCRDGDPRYVAICVGEPTRVVGGIAFSAIDAGTTHTCGLSTDGLAWCWGVNDWGQLGDGTLTSSPVPVAVEGGRRYSSIRVGSELTCAEAVGGGVYCWGNNRNGGVGLGVMPYSMAPVRTAGSITFGGTP